MVDLPKHFYSVLFRLLTRIKFVLVTDFDDYLITIVSCKTSFHGRFTETFL